MSPPLLSCKDARVDADGSPLLEALSCETTKDRVVLVGQWTALFRALSGEARVTRGSVAVSGHRLENAVSDNTVGLALYDPELPPSFTPIEYLSKGAELLGVPVRAARRLAESALEQTGIGALAKRKFAMMPSPERRAVLIANALVGSPEALAIDRPLARLDEEPASFVRQVLERAASGRRLLVSMEAPASEGPERRLLDTAEEALVYYAGSGVMVLDRNHPMLPGRRYVVTAFGNSAAFADALIEKGVQIQPALPTDGPSRLVLFLPDGVGTDAVIAVAASLSVPLLAMVPLDIFGDASPRRDLA